MYNYSKLSGKISEKFRTRGAFALAMGCSERTLSLKMSGVIPWKQTEMAKACELLSIKLKEIPNYFFAA